MTSQMIATIVKDMIRLLELDYDIPGITAELEKHSQEVIKRSRIFAKYHNVVELHKALVSIRDTKDVIRGHIPRIRFRSDYMEGHTNLKAGMRLMPPICVQCKEQTKRFGTSLQGNIALFACMKCNPEIFAELDRMRGE